MGDRTSDILVEGVNVSKTYPCGATSVQAVKDATFSVEQQARIAIVGPSGSGKTTLLHLMSGIDSPSNGTVAWPALGSADTLRPRHVAVCFQNPSLLPALSMVENVALPLLLAGQEERSAVSDALRVLERLGLSGLAERLPEEVSGGQAQRFALARALVAKPALLLADEPTGQQDHAHGSRLIDMLLESADEDGMAVIVATHDPVVAERLQTTWTMRDGSLTIGVA